MLRLYILDLLLKLERIANTRRMKEASLIFTEIFLSPISCPQDIWKIPVVSEVSE